MRRLRWLARLRARLTGYFWLPCPACGREFAGFEWAWDREDEWGPSTIPHIEGANRSLAICPGCQRNGVGTMTRLGARLAPVVVYSVGPFYASVCALERLPVTEVEAVVNAQHPTGISTRWTRADEPFAGGGANPSPCNDSPGRLHWLLSL